MPDPTPPLAKIVPTSLEKHGDVRTDNYYWLREREDPILGEAVIAYLEAENDYTATLDKLDQLLWKVRMDWVFAD